MAIQSRMRVCGAIVAFIVLSPSLASAQSDSWHIDVGGTALVEVWDLNAQREVLAGAIGGVERRVWQTLRLRVEGWLLRGFQEADDAWSAGFTIGPRWRWGAGAFRPFAELGVGLSQSTEPVPPGGTRFNYVAQTGGGIQVTFGDAQLDVGARWLHLSNNGREGRDRNPDIQSLGTVVAIGWSH
jgi:hypothetical protein